MSIEMGRGCKTAPTIVGIYKKPE